MLAVRSSFPKVGLDCYSQRNLNNKTDSYVLERDRHVEARTRRLAVGGVVRKTCIWRGFG